MARRPRRDLRHAGRLLRRNPVFTITATLSLAIGIGANTTIFTVANALLLPAPCGRGRAAVSSTSAAAGAAVASVRARIRTILDIRQRATTLDGVYAYSRFPQAMSLGGAGVDGGIDSIFGSVVTVNYFTVLGAVPAAGRLFGAGDSEQPGARPGRRAESRLLDPALQQGSRRRRPDVTLNGHPFTWSASRPRGSTVPAFARWTCGCRSAWWRP